MTIIESNHQGLSDVVSQQCLSAPSTPSAPQGARSYQSYGIVDSNSNPTSTPSPSLSLETQGKVPPADRGKAAWLFLFGCFWLEGLVWGLPYSYGVFEQYYLNHEPFSSQRGLAAIGTTGLGLAYFVSPLVIFMLQRWPSRRKPISILGLVLITIALICSSLTYRVSHLIITQGALYGVGVALLYNPFIFYLDEWFVKRKGLAFGVFWAGTGFAGSVVPLILDWGLDSYGIQTTLQAWAVFVVTALSCLIYLIKPRLPLPVRGVGNIIQGLGYFMPPIYLPSYASSIGTTPAAATLSVSLFNLTSTIGMILTGLLIDRYHISTILLISSLGSAMSVLLIWGFATFQPILFIFAFTYGVFAGGYASTWTGCAADIRKETGRGEIAVIIGTMAAGRGIGCVISGPVSESLLRSKRWLGASPGVYRSEYGNLILFTGLALLLGSIGSTGRLRRWALKSPETGLRRMETQPLLA
ncbi:hypothetical protein MMC07_000665 [Pseudocyphellaria aurata]|nr:hypothetical protein [Pseudocyphellaria aurata]